MPFNLVYFIYTALRCKLPPVTNMLCNTTNKNKEVDAAKVFSDENG